MSSSLYNQATTESVYEARRESVTPFFGESVAPRYASGFGMSFPSTGPFKAKAKRLTAQTFRRSAPLVLPRHLVRTARSTADERSALHLALPFVGRPSHSVPFARPRSPHFPSSHLYPNFRRRAVRPARKVPAKSSRRDRPRQGVQDPKPARNRSRQAQPETHRPGHARRAPDPHGRGAGGRRDQVGEEHLAAFGPSAARDGRHAQALQGGQGRRLVAAPCLLALVRRQRRIGKTDSER